MNLKIKKIKAFTIVEMLVVIGIVGLILPLFFSIVFTLLKQQVQISLLQRVKQAGDLASTQIQRVVRNSAQDINSLTCQSDPVLSPFVTGADTVLYFSDAYNNCFAYYVKDQALSSISATFSEAVNFIDSSDTDLPLKITSQSFTKESQRLAKFKFTVTSEPLVSYLKSQSLSYQFFVFLRN